MGTKIPVRLKKEPLIETVWEVRFSSPERSVADLLPGLIYKEQPKKYHKTLRLPWADIPTAVAEHERKLRYKPRIQLEGDNRVIQIGEHMVALSCHRPYPGWRDFSGQIRELIDVIRRNGLIERPERFSLKYIDLIELNQPPDLGCLNVDVKLGSPPMDSQSVYLRTETQKNELLSIVQVISPAQVDLPDEPDKSNGVLLDTDIINPLEEDESWREINDRLDHVHAVSKQVFFDLLTPATIEELEPEYEEQTR